MYLQKALMSLAPGAAWVLEGETLDGLIWLDGVKPRPTNEAILSEVGNAKKATAWDAIQAERNRRTREGGYQVAGKWFHSDEFSRGQQLGLVLLGASIPAGLQWKTMDGTFVTMTSAMAQQILGAAAASDTAIFAAAEVHKAAMEASTDPAAYDFSSGWPKVFGEV